MKKNERRAGDDEDKFLAWGKHLILDAYGIEYKKLKNIKAVKELLGSLPKKFKMRPLGSAVVRKVSSDNYPDWGLSGFIMLYESHISFHTWPERGYVAMDLYSCKDFDDEKIVKYLQRFWGYKKIKMKLVIRG